jgi:hypothetical protein
MIELAQGKFGSSVPALELGTYRLVKPPWKIHNISDATTKGLLILWFISLKNIPARGHLLYMGHYP